MCSLCGVQNNADEPLGLFSEEELDALAFAIFAGIVTTQSLDIRTYLKIARKLLEGVFLGFGKEIDKVVYASEDYLMLKSLRDNVYIFSGAKTYQQVREVSGLLVGDKINSYRVFRDKAMKILTDYNENYLKTEYQSAIAQSKSASQWMEFEADKEHVEMLTYHTVGDGRVRPTHAELDDITRPVDDKFWNIHFPPNGWNCRCTVLQNNDNEQTNLRGFRTPEDVPDIFRFNAGKERIVFSKKHPYFRVEEKDKDWAKQNFGMPMP